jgi:F-type H+-transporting ATPase subunit gamma
MPNVLDIRRRIRSVTNTRQITKAMKMVSAAKLRRAQERALSSRPYAQMLTNILKSLVSRAEIYDPETGEPRHPLLAQRPENNVLFLVVTGDKGLAGAFNTNILKAASRFLETKAGKNIEIEAIGRKGRDFLRRRYSFADPRTAESNHEARTTIIGEKVGILSKIDIVMADEIAERVIQRYSECEIDSVYIVYNEFKSVIAQRLVVEQVLPIEEVGTVAVRMTEEITQAERERAV